MLFRLVVRNGFAQFVRKVFVRFATRKVLFFCASEYEIVALTARTVSPNPTSSRSQGQDHNHAHDLHDHPQHEKKAAEVR